MRAAPLLVLLPLALLAGCATNPLSSARFWPLESCVGAPSTRIRFADGATGAPLAVVERAACERLDAAAKSIQAQAGYPVHRVFISDLTEVNAFATLDSSARPVVVVNLGMLTALGADEAAWAGLLGHEIAHLARGHRHGRAQAQSGAQAGGQVLGQAVAQLIPGLGGLVAANATSFAVTHAMYGAYTRSQETEADEYGLRWMHAAGYDPRGMVRLFSVLRERGGGTALPFLSTHPGSDERAEAAEAFATRNPVLPKPAAANP